jgi:hypothetical protein
MKQEKKLRRLKHLVHKYDMMLAIYFRSYEKGKLNYDLIAYFDERIESYSDFGDSRSVEWFKAFSEIKALVLDLSLTKEEYFKICTEERKKINDAQDLLRVNNLKETRDNKGVYVGSGGSNKNRIRYPKKARSKRVWRIFYEMFPNLVKK